MRRRKFGAGGVTDDDLEAANASEDPIAELNARKKWTDSEEPTSQSMALKEAAGEEILKRMRDTESAKAAAPKSRVVSKSELEKSGMSLRDFLNKEQGLTRRGGEVTPAKSSPSKNEVPSAPTARISGVSGIPGSSPVGWTGGKGEREDGTELGRNVSNTLNALSGPASGLGAMSRAAKTAGQVGGRGLASLETPVTYLGKSGARQVGGGEELMNAARQAVTNNPTARLANNPTKQLPGPTRGGASAKTVKKAEKKALSEEDWTGGATGYRKGGSISKASSRADGIAQRGKTRGAMR